ncbi:MAG: D-glycero-beta-D-manno-heptose 1-phosphate adenylyltransferase [Candidatus Acidiferrales bacterium]
MLGRVVTQDELMRHVAEEKRNGRRIVFTNGCYDLLHPGHIRLLESARELGDILILALNSDRSVRENKGANRPIISEAERAEVAAALAAVDYVVLFDEATPREIIARVVPDVLVKGSDWGPDEVVGREEVEAAGGRVVSIPLEPGYSTSAIIERILKIPS